MQLNEDAISRKSIKQKLQEHHDFFVNAYGGFSNLPQNDKSRVDEITNCIAMVVNEPSVQPKPKTDVFDEIEPKCDRINSLASVLPYTAHREIQELLCEIMDLCKAESECEE